MSQFIHLHVHSEYSVLDGLGTIDEYVARAKKLGQPALALTDHGVLCGIPEFYGACRKAEIEPLVGEEFYFSPYPPESREAERYHVVMLARGYDGYKTLTSLSTAAHANFYYKPMLTREVLNGLGDEASNVTVLSGCGSSIISRNIQLNLLDEAAEELLWWRETFPHFYLELQQHGTAFDKKVNRALIKLGKKYNVPWVITNDPHYAVKEDDCHHDVLLALQTASDINDPDRFRFDGDGYHLRSQTEMRKAFRSYGDDVWIPGRKATVKVAKDCHTRIPEWEKRSWHIPKFPGTDDPFEYLTKLTVKGLKQKGLFTKAKYRKQAKYELGVIKKAKIADFLLITMDCIKWARDNGIPVGPARGSVAGCLVAYAIDIHRIDPIRYELMFERFLNPERPRMPDIDVDFGTIRREEMFKYVTEKYGRENVMHICTFQRMKVKAAFQMLAKSYGVSYVDSIRISKSLDDSDDVVDRLPPEITDRYPDIADHLERLAGVKRAISTHPAGVIIADPGTPVRKLVPEMWIPTTKRWVGQYDLESIEHMGLMKQDFLGLRTLDTISECVKLIKESTGEEVDPDTWWPDNEENDADIYKMLTSGKTAGVFQMEGNVNTRGIQAIGCAEFEDIVSCTSLYRSGPILAGYPDKFIRNRERGRENIVYSTPKLKPILERTWGVILYQEQVMEIAEKLAGFDMATVDDIKEAIKHKRSPLMISLKPKFVQGCKANGISEEISGLIWKDIEGYASYSYNRAHAVAYSFMSYQTARLKYMWPAQYITALLRTVDDKEKRIAYLTEALELGLKIKAPCINRGDVWATPAPGGIRFGFGDMHGIGAKQAAKIVAGRPAEGYQTVEELTTAVGNKKVLQTLVDGGACKCLGIAGKAAFMEQSLNWQFKDRMLKWRRKYQDQVLLPAGDKDYVCVIGELVKSKQAYTKSGKPFCTWQVRWSPTKTYSVRLWQETASKWNVPVGSIVQVEGDWEDLWSNISINSPEQIKVKKRSG